MSASRRCCSCVILPAWLTLAETLGFSGAQQTQGRQHRGCGLGVWSRTLRSALITPPTGQRRTARADPHDYCGKKTRTCGALAILLETRYPDPAMRQRQLFFRLIASPASVRHLRPLSGVFNLVRPGRWTPKIFLRIPQTPCPSTSNGASVRRLRPAGNMSLGLGEL